MASSKSAFIGFSELTLRCLMFLKGFFIDSGCKHFFLFHEGIYTIKKGFDNKNFIC